MAFMKFNRFTECESGATILTEWLELPHLEQQLIKLRLNTGAMFTELFSRTMVGQTKLPRKYRHNGKMKRKVQNQEAKMEESGENTVTTVKGCISELQPNLTNEFSEVCTGDFRTVGEEIMEHCKIEETMSNNNKKL